MYIRFEDFRHGCVSVSAWRCVKSRKLVRHKNNLSLDQSSGVLEHNQGTALCVSPLGLRVATGALSTNIAIPCLTFESSIFFEKPFS